MLCIPDLRLVRLETTVSYSSPIMSFMFAMFSSLTPCSLHRGLRHFWGIKVRGQHTATTGRGRSRLMAAKNAGK